MSLTDLAVLAAVLGLIPAVIAAKKGQPFLVFWLFGALIFPVALVVTILMPNVRPRCPHCRENIQEGATLCPHCRTPLTEPAEPGEQSRPFSHIEPL